MSCIETRSFGLLSCFRQQLMKRLMIYCLWMISIATHSFWLVTPAPQFLIAQFWVWSQAPWVVSLMELKWVIVSTWWFQSWVFHSPVSRKQLCALDRLMSLNLMRFSMIELVGWASRFLLSIEQLSTRNSWCCLMSLTMKIVMLVFFR